MTIHISTLEAALVVSLGSLVYRASDTMAKAFGPQLFAEADMNQFLWEEVYMQCSHSYV